MMRERESTRVGRRARGAAAVVAAVCASSVSYWLRLLLVLATAASFVLVCLPDAASLGGEKKPRSSCYCFLFDLLVWTDVVVVVRRRRTTLSYFGDLSHLCR